jgi:hypothetical protein
MSGRKSRAWRLVWTLSLAGTIGIGACTGNIGDGGVGAGEDGEPTDPVTESVASLKTTRFPRLSHQQWENTVRDLFRLTAVTGSSSSFSGDPLGGVFDNNADKLLVSPAHWQDYQTAAEEVAALVAADPAIVANISPAGLPSDLAEAGRAFIESFGKRAYRRPLTTNEVDALLAVFVQGPDLLEGTDDFVRGVQLTVQAILQSPHFLYRVESTAEVEDDGLIHLTGWEVASKLSYMLWNTMPDDTLFAAAEQGELGTPEGILAQAERMLEDVQSRPMVATMHAQLFQYDHYDDLYKDPAYFPSFPVDVGDDLKREAELFIEDVMLSGGGLRELLTSPVTYVNADLAAVYGVQGSFTDEFVKVELDPAERAGFLTRIGFLASNATPREQNTIHRGVFINHRIMCTQLPDPPDNVEGLPPSDGYPTNRERVESHTGPGTCGESCHQVWINPPGYALEHYNAIGAYQDIENGETVDALSEWEIDGEAVAFDGAVELSQLMAESDAAHHCYAKHWLQYSYGRTPQEGDGETIQQLADASKAGSVKDLIVALSQTLAFRTRAVVAAEEQGP